MTDDDDMDGEKEAHNLIRQIARARARLCFLYSSVAFSCFPQCVFYVCGVAVVCMEKQDKSFYTRNPALERIFSKGKSLINQGLKLNFTTVILLGASFRQLSHANDYKRVIDKSLLLKIITMDLCCSRSPAMTTEISIAGLSVAYLSTSISIYSLITSYFLEQLLR